MIKGSYNIGGEDYTLAPIVQVTLERFTDAIHEFLDVAPEDIVTQFKDVKTQSKTFLGMFITLPYSLMDFVIHHQHILTAAMIIPSVGDYNVQKVRAIVREKMGLITIAQVWTDFFQQQDALFVICLVQKLFPMIAKTQKILIEALSEISKA